MRKNAKHEPIPDAETPEWTAEKFARAKRIQELPEGLQKIFAT